MRTRARLRVGVIGVGAIGWHHARHYATLPGAELVAVADTQQPRAAAAADRFGCRAYDDYGQMLSQEDLDAVSIATPTGLHHRVALETIRAGVHALVEKPLAASVAEANEMVVGSRARGVKLAVGHVERFNPAVRELKKLVESGELGAVTALLTRRFGPIPYRITDADVILDLAVHDIDVALWLFDRPPSAIQASAGRPALDDRFDHCRIELRFGSARCLIQAGWIAASRTRTAVVIGEAGRVELDYLRQRLVLRRAGDGGAGGPELPLSIVWQEPLRLQLEAFLHGVAGRGPLAVDAELGLDVLAVVDGVRRAMGQSVAAAVG